MTPGQASPFAPEVDVLEGQRVGQQQVHQRPPRHRPAEAGPGAGVPHTCFLQYYKRGHGVPPTPPASPLHVPWRAGSMTASLPHSPQTAPTPICRGSNSIDQAPPMSQQVAGPSAHALIIVPEMGRVCPFTEGETEVQSGQMTCPKPIARKWQGQDGPKACQPPQALSTSPTPLGSLLWPPRMGHVPTPYLPR